MIMVVSNAWWQKFRGSVVNILFCDIEWKWMFQAVRRIQTSLQQQILFKCWKESCCSVYDPHEKQMYFFLKDIHIQNDENVFFWFIYLIFIYFYKIKKNIWNKRLTSLQGFEKEKEKSHRTNRDYSTCVFFYMYKTSFSI